MLIRSFFHQAGRAVLLGLVFLFSGTTRAATIEVTDAIGRKVKVASPVQRVVVNFNHEEFTAVAGKEAWAKVGIDFGLTLVARLRTPAYAKAVQLYLEYDPAPPFNASSPDKAPRLAREFLTDMFAELTQAAHATARRAMARLG